jgi:hypothetical protein
MKVSPAPTVSCTAIEMVQPSTVVNGALIEAVGIRHFAWNRSPEPTTNYRGIPEVSATCSGNLQECRFRRNMSNSVGACHLNVQLDIYPRETVPGARSAGPALSCTACGPAAFNDGLRAVSQTNVCERSSLLP